jgi:hypothetical protein
MSSPQVHNIDLTGQEVPWQAIGQLNALEDLSLWNCGLGGPIEAGALCQLRGLRVLALSQNALRGRAPECIVGLPLEWLWLDENRIHGPISEYAPLGQYLKNVDSLNLAQNRWAPLLRAEKGSLDAAAKPLGITAAEQDWAGHSWDFDHSYEWCWVTTPTTSGLTAQRDMSHRYWGAGVPLVGLKMSLPFKFPHRGEIATMVGIGRDGDLAIGERDSSNLVFNAVNAKATVMQSDWRGTSYVGCFYSDGTVRSNQIAAGTRKHLGNLGQVYPQHSAEWLDACETACAGYSYIGLDWQNECFCDNMYGVAIGEVPALEFWPGQPAPCGDDGVNCGRGDAAACGGWTASIYTVAAWSMQFGHSDAASIGTAQTSSCWATLPNLVPHAHTVSELPEAAASSQGADYLSERFCPGWGKFIAPATCDLTEPGCTGDDASGNAIFDGGGDMYDLGNVLTTSLMGDCTSDPHGCPLGSLRYGSDFAPVETSCFGSGGHYQMAKLDGVWVFFTHNTGEGPLDFAVIGNLGSDGSGKVTEYTFEAAPYVGFVKRECGAGNDPSVNHLVVVDSIVGGRPVHSCDQATGGVCDGASSDIDDDAVSAIAPGSPILYLLYSSEGGHCIKEDEHRAIFDAAVRCLWAEDPYAAVDPGWQVGSQPLIEVAVDDQHHIVFGGTAPYTGWAHTSTPHHISGPGGFPTALQFVGTQWLQLGESGIEVEGNWTLDCYIQVSAQALQHLSGEGALLASADGVVHVGAADLIGLLASVSDGWYRLTVLTVRVEQLPQREHRTILVDGVAVASTSKTNSLCDGVSRCPAIFFAVGGLADGSAPFPLPVHHLRLYGGVVNLRDAPGSAQTDAFTPLRYHAENSRWVKISRGADAVEITWDAFGWETVAHDQVQVMLEPTGNLLLKGTNASRLWDRAIGSVSGITKKSDTANWTSAASYRAEALQITYVESDPCYDLWEGIECSQSDWPVGRTDCAERLDCTGLGWDSKAAGSDSVCGTSALLGLLGSGDMCVREASFAHASDLCQEMGARLCTADELAWGEGDPSTCGYDSIFAWTWAGGGQNACPSSNQSFGVAGTPVAWYSFSPVARGVYHEIQLRTEGMSSHSISTNILDENAELVHPMVPPTMHRRVDGVMLRWNITRGGGPYYMRVTSPDLESSFLMVAVAPPVYSQAPADPKAWATGAHERTELSVSVGSAVLIDLGFSFPFFGLPYDRAWISSAGYVAFEGPPEIDGFAGLDGVHSVVVAAAGEYNLDHVGAILSVSRFGAAEVEVAWHAPLFDSVKFTDVALRLVIDGTVGVRWDRIVLDNIGSLGHKLLSQLSFDELPPMVDAIVTESIGELKVPAALAVGPDGSASIVYTAGATFNTTVGAFYGFGAGHRGLDCSGDFLYAVDVNGPGRQHIGDAWFSSEANTTGVLVSTPGDGSTKIVLSSSEYRSFGASVEDQGLESLLGTMLASASMAWVCNHASCDNWSGDARIQVTMEGLDPGSRYGLQLLFYDICECTDMGQSRRRCSAGTVCEYDETPGLGKCFDVLVNGVLIVDDFDPGAIQGGSNIHDAGAFIRHEFVADANMVMITLDAGRCGYRVPYTHRYAILNAITLERLLAPAQVQKVDELALRLTGDAYVQLPPVVLGGSVAVTAWLRVGTLWDGWDGFSLFSSFQDTSCGDSDACRNAVGETFDSHGWLVVGNDMAAKRPADLWAAGIIFDKTTAALFWEGARDKWLMVTFVVSGHAMHVYIGSQLRGVGALQAPLPRMLRQNNYIGAGFGAPFRPKAGEIGLAISDFHLYDRSLAAGEVEALFAKSTGEHTACCVAAGIRSPFGVGDVDLTAQAMGVVVTGMPAAATISSQSPRNSSANSGVDSECSSTQRQEAREVDICGDFVSVSECYGTISDGIGPYAESADCAVRLAGSVGSQHVLSFNEFELEAGVDFLRVFDGADGSAPLMGSLSGTELPATLTSSGPDLYLQFTSDGNNQAVGFRATFACSGTPLEHWRPATVATTLSLGVLTEPTTLKRQQTACLSDMLLSVQCCADAELSCANARVTGVGLSKHQLRGSLPAQLGDFGALRSLKLHDNFLTGTFPSSLGKLHWLQELQLSHNQFSMQSRADLSRMLGGMLQLQTLDLGMSNEVQDLGKSIILPAPPLACRVDERCGFVLSTRTVAGLSLPHGGLQVRVRKVEGGDDALCDDTMDGSYECQIPPTWTAVQGNFDFVVSADGEDFVPVRTLTDPTTGVVSTQDTYQRLAALVAPIQCTAAHAHPDVEGAQCVCEAGYYRRSSTTTGGYSCEHCDRGQQPVEGGARCSLCVPGTYSATGEGCAVCPPGNEPNKLSGADSCTPCGGHSVSEYGDHCTKCEADQVADPSRTVCVCPTGLYNSSRYGGNMVQCVPKNLRGGGRKAVSSCTPCEGLPCVKCTSGLEVVPGWSTTGSDSPWIVFGCPFQHACTNTADGQRCAVGHTGILCAECEPGYGLTGEECVECVQTVHRWYVAAVVLGVVAAVSLVVYLCWQHQQGNTKKDGGGELAMQLTDNPLQAYGHKRSPRGSLSHRAAEQRSNAYLAVRILYQPARILVGYIQARGAWLYLSTVTRSHLVSRCSLRRW